MYKLAKKFTYFHPVPYIDEIRFVNIKLNISIHAFRRNSCVQKKGKLWNLIFLASAILLFQMEDATAYYVHNRILTAFTRNLLD